MKFKPLSQREEDIGRQIVDSTYRVHSALGPGLLESVYEKCFCYELTSHGLSTQRQLSVPIQYHSLRVESAFKLDVPVENAVICELKAVETMNPLYEAQLLSYMKLMNKRLGYLINFHVPRIRFGIKRMIL